MICPNCASINPDETKNCVNCGAPLRAAENQVSAGSPAGIPPEFIELPNPAPPYVSPEPEGKSAQPTTGTIETTNNPAEEQTPGVNARPAAKLKSGRELAILLEILPGLLGILGLGWIYAGNKKVGLGLLIGYLAWDFIVLILAITTGLTACFCTLPLNVLAVIVSVLLLNGQMEKQV